MDFYPVITEDGTVSLFNTVINDVYHSKIGAFTEAVLKFVKPSGIVDFARDNNEVKILDICFGLGYNSKAAISEIKKINPECKISITALEYDPYVLAYSTLVNNNLFSVAEDALINATIADVINVDLFKELILDDVSFLKPVKNDTNFSDTDLPPKDENNSPLHNIYYRTLSNRTNNVIKTSNKDHNTEFNLWIGDARHSIMELKGPYDFVFHDAFTPSKLPTLWSVELFRSIYALLNDKGNLTTYSASSPVRSGLIKAGFFIGSIDPIGRKSLGTFACKDNSLIKNQLSLRESGLLKTKAGIPYSDPKLNYSGQEIQEYRNNIMSLSNRISSSRFIKDYDKGLIS